MDKLPRPHRLIFPLTVLLVLLSAGATWVSAQDKPAADAEPKPPEIPTFVVTGRVVYEHTDRPVRRAQISLMQLPERRGVGEYSSATDREGRFTISNVPPGVYFAFVNSPGIITPYAFMALNEKGPSDSFDVKAIKEYCTEVVVSSDVGVTVRARRGGAISGKITYADGEPAVNVDVAVVRRANNQMVRVLTGLNATALLSLHTDDRGRYRISGVPPGEYVVSAAEKNTAPKYKSNRGYGMDAFFGSGDALTVTYYGGSTNVVDALKLQVEANSELTDVDISLPDMTPHTIRGSIIAKLDRIPLRGATVSIRMKHHADWFDQGARQIAADEQGHWVADDIPDGAYILRVEPPTDIPVPGAAPLPTPDDPEDLRGRQQAPTRKFVPSEAQVMVAGGDVVVEPIALAEGASISGTLELPSEMKEISGFHLQLTWRYEGEPTASYRNSTSAYGESFSIEGLREGKIYLNATFSPYGLSLDESSKYYVKSIKLNGLDVLSKPITVKEGQSVRDVRIVIAAGRANASVKLVTSEDKPVSSRSLAIVPIEQSRWLFQSEMMKGMTDSHGQMSFTCAPGEYLVLVSTTEDVWPPTYESIKQRSADAPRIKVSSGENKTFVVPVP